MAQQNFKNHRKVYPAHHLIFYPIVIAGIILCVRFSFKYSAQHFEFILMAGMIFVIAWLSFMMRQHYALGLQDRVVRLEMRLRYYQLTGQRLETIEGKLSFGQIAALRFASDAELPGLLQKALNENLSPNEIKKLVTNWQADGMRV